MVQTARQWEIHFNLLFWQKTSQFKYLLNLNLKFSIPTFAFINIQEPEHDELSDDFNNKRRLQNFEI